MKKIIKSIAWMLLLASVVSVPTVVLADGNPICSSSKACLPS